ncbi:methyl-accepting chemotaxis protein [Aeromonas enteropelogenes]|uniref:methyl-accepting chemotaxis protein n=1 Tax=Aeromonas enteropelogenes TaxID=29489 RepID=UPI0022863D92|nr:methyl-accepting chemotaxis protein [Aeromonas enteropelogenes]MCZ0753875.1 methyl-accepting chemotaxis protein [Aeromonas enteropelogenes]
MINLIRLISIKTRLMTAFLLVNLILIGVGLYGKQNISVINNMLNEMYLNNLTPIKDIAKANMQAIYHNRSLFNYVIEQTKPGMDTIAVKMEGYEQKMNEMLNQYRATELTEPEKAVLADFDHAWSLYKETAKKVMAASYANDNDSAVKLMKGDATTTFLMVDDQLSKLIGINDELAKKAYVDSDVIVADINTTTYIVLTLSVILSLVLGWLLSLSINQPLAAIVEELKQLAAGYLTGNDNREGDDEVTQMQISMGNARRSLQHIVSTMQHAVEGLTASASQLIAAAQQVNSSSQQQSLATANTAASVEELTTSVSQLSSFANQVNNVVMESGEIAHAGEEQVKRASQEVVRVTAAVNDSAKQVQGLFDDITRISQISVMIQGVADQTNLLALNAAIEAARAGDMGRGFAVVADEVRTLAARTTQATKEINEMLQSIQQGATGAVKGMNTCADRMGAVRETTDHSSNTMAQVDQSSRKVVGLIQEISSMLHEQAAASQLIAQSVEEITQMSVENVAAAESVNHDASQLTDIIHQLDQGIRFFKV